MSSCSHVKISLTEKWKEGERETALLSAAEDGHESCVDLLVFQGVDVNYKNDSGDTALIIASRLGHTQCVQSLVQVGADVNITNDSGDTALVLATSSGNIDSVYSLIQAGADVNHTDKLREEVLKLDITSNHVECAKFLLQTEGGVNNELLSVAAEQGSYDIIKMLIEAGVDVNKSNRKGNMSLILAVGNGHERCAELLVENGADVNRENTKTETPLMVAAAGGHAGCVSLLIQTGADVNQTSSIGLTCLMFAAKHGNDKCVKLLIEAGADVNKGDICTALFRALCKLEVMPSDYSLAETVKHLVKAGANVNTKRHSLTPLKLAAFTNNVSALQLFIEKGADVNFVGEDSTSAVDAAIRHDSAECMEELLAAGGEMHITDSSRFSLLLTRNEFDFRKLRQLEVTNDSAAMIYCAFYDSYRCMKVLLEKGVDVNRRTKDDRTILMLAVEHGSHRCLITLLEAGADVNMPTSEGRTTLMMAAKKGLLKCLGTLLAAGAHVNKVDSWEDDNALMEYLENHRQVNRKICLMLLAAGELVKRESDVDSDDTEDDSETCERKILKAAPAFLRRKKLKMNLMHICRRAIRKHLLKLDQHENLFIRIPQLGLPSIVTEYLLYGVSLKDSECDIDDEEEREEDYDDDEDDDDEDDDDDDDEYNDELYEGVNCKDYDADDESDDDDSDDDDDDDGIADDDDDEDDGDDTESHFRVETTSVSTMMIG